MAYKKSNANGQATMTNSEPVVIASDQSAVPVSAASLPLPAGAATVAKQPALGTAGTPSADLITVQGISSMTPLVTSNTTTSVVGNGGAATAQRVTLANDSTGIIATVGAVTAISNALPAGTNAIGKLAANSGVDIGDVDVTTINGVAPAFNTGTRGATVQRVTIATDDAVPVTDNSSSLTVDAPLATPVFTTITPNTTGGWTSAQFTSADGSTALTSTAQAIKGGAGTFGGYYIYNPNSSATYVHIYNVAAGSVTVGTTNPQLTFCIPATSGANVEITNGVNFSTAMSIAATTTGGGNTAPSTAMEALIWFK